MFKKMGKLGDLADLMTKAKEFQARMEEMQEELSGIVVTGESGAGLVKASVTVKGELVGVEIDPKIFHPDEKEMVEDLILAAVKNAQAKATARGEMEMQKLTQGLGIPEGIKLPF